MIANQALHFSAEPLMLTEMLETEMVKGRP